jgi:hypothetical protein
MICLDYVIYSLVISISIFSCNWQRKILGWLKNKVFTLRSTVPAKCCSCWWNKLRSSYIKKLWTNCCNYLIAFLSFIQFILALIYWKCQLGIHNIDTNQPQSWSSALKPIQTFSVLFKLWIIWILLYPDFNRYTLNSNAAHSANTYVTPDVGVSLIIYACSS